MLYSCSETLISHKGDQMSSLNQAIVYIFSKLGKV